jgi:outer membrane receptor protein involved in Fe transport
VSHNKKVIVPNKVALAAAVCALQIGAAWAQNAPAAAPLNLDEMVITASPTGRSKMKSSDSISSVGEEAIARVGATSAAEILRAIPGIRAESSGGEGNANVTVRGAPISAGGSRYVQFQENGLPVLLFGDTAFGTADQFLRTDFNTDRVEVVRGGGASTLVSNAPGGVINFIDKAGKDVGNAMGITTGLGSRLNRYDFNYGGALGERTYFNLGGFYRQGEGGAHKTGFNSEEGGQFKASVTRELDAGGYVRVNFKRLDDKTPSYLPVPVSISGGAINTLPGIDPRNAYFINSSLTRDTTQDRSGNLVTSNPADGLHVKSTAVGLESKINLGDGWSLDERFRKSANSGRFMAMFPSNNGNATPAGTFSGVLFNTSLDNLDNVFNDIKLSKSLDVAGGKALITGGLFAGSQTVAQTWFWNTYNVGLTGHGANISGPTAGGASTFGGCCDRTWDVRYTTTAPYAAINWETGPVTIDASLRRSSLSASGQTIQGTAPAGASTTSPLAGSWNPATLDTVNYKTSKNSYSLGGNFAFNADTTVYARISDGYNFSADRLLYGTTGALNNKPTSVNQLKQQELGVKHRQGNLSLVGTLFRAQTDESNYEATTQRFTSNEYKAKGLELEMGYRLGGFRINGGLTYTKAEISKSLNAAEVGKTPRRQADFMYSVLPSYRNGDFELGAAFVGTTKAYGDDGNTIVMPGYVITNLFASYQITKQLVAAVSVNNAFNKLAYTEVEGGGGSGHAARALAGRSAKLSLKYNF